MTPLTSIVSRIRIRKLILIVNGADPFPDIAAYIERADPGNAAGLAANRRGLAIGIAGIDNVIGYEIITPGIDEAVRPARCIFPFSFGGQPRPATFAEGIRIRPVDAFTGAVVASEPAR